MTLTIEKRLIDNEKYGAFIRYIPVLDSTGQPCFDGQIRFAHWEVSVGSPMAEHDEACAKAKQNAVETLRRIADSLGGLKVR
jgi:hypothetical protein